MLLRQTKHMQHLLDRYGFIVGMDGTYRTTMWGFPVYLLTIVDNHRHGQPVAWFVPEDETSATLALALKRYGITLYLLNVRCLFPAVLQITRHAG